MKNQYMPKIKIFSIGLIEYDLSLNLDDFDLDEFKIDLEHIESISDFTNFLNETNIRKKYDIYSKGLNFILILMNKLLNNKMENLVLSINNLTFNDEQTEFLRKIIVNYYRSKNISIIESNLVIPTMTNLTLNHNETKIKEFYLKYKANNKLKADLINPNNRKELSLFDKNSEKIQNVYTSLEVDQSIRNEHLFIKKRNQPLDDSSGYFSNIDVNLKNFDIFFLDISFFLSLNMCSDNQSKISLSSLYYFIKKILSESFKSTKIILIMPIHQDISKNNIEYLVKLSNLSHYIIFDKKAAYKFSILLGYKFIYEDNYILKKFAQIEEFKEKLFNDQMKMWIFFENVRGITIVKEEDNKFSSIHKKIDITEMVLDNYKTQKNLFKNSFIAGFFSKFIETSDIESSFQTGKEALFYYCNILLNNQIIDDNSNIRIKTNKDNTLNKTSFKKDFFLDCLNKNNSTLKSYVPIQDKSLKSFFLSPIKAKVVKKLKLYRQDLNSKSPLKLKSTLEINSPNEIRSPIEINSPIFIKPCFDHKSIIDSKSYSIVKNNPITNDKMKINDIENFARSTSYANVVNLPSISKKVNLISKEKAKSIDPTIKKEILSPLKDVNEAKDQKIMNVASSTISIFKEKYKAKLSKKDEDIERKNSNKLLAKKLQSIKRKFTLMNGFKDDDKGSQTPIKSTPSELNACQNEDANNSGIYFPKDLEKFNEDELELNRKELEREKIRKIEIEIYLKEKDIQQKLKKEQEEKEARIQKALELEMREKEKEERLEEFKKAEKLRLEQFNKAKLEEEIKIQNMKKNKIR